MLRREDGHALRKTLDIVVEGQQRKGRPKITSKKQVEDESIKAGFNSEDAFC